MVEGNKTVEWRIGKRLVFAFWGESTLTVKKVKTAGILSNSAPDQVTGRPVDSLRQCHWTLEQWKVEQCKDDDVRSHRL